MNLLDGLKIGGHILSAKLFGISRPIAIRWSLTYDCNQQCLYCGIPNTETYALDQENICRRIDDFVQLGTRWISFTGGEPLLRSDLPAIVNHAKSRGVYVTISTNGALLAEKIQELSGVDRIKLSLDGPEAVHDPIKGKGSYCKVMEAIKLCHRNNIKVVVDCVLSKYNLGAVDDLIAICRNNKIKVLFQPATIRGLNTENSDIFLPPIDEYRAVIVHLIALKKHGAPIRNSVAGLKHLACWPDPRAIPCHMGQITFTVEPNGVIGACIDKEYVYYMDKVVFQDAYTTREIVKNIPVPQGCRECWCGAMVEFNLMASLNLDAIANHILNS